MHPLIREYDCLDQIRMILASHVSPSQDLQKRIRIQSHPHIEGNLSCSQAVDSRADLR